MIRAYHIENGVFAAFRATCALLPDCVDIISARQNSGLKRLFAARAALARISRRHGCHLCRRTRPMPCRFVAWRLFVGLLQNIRSTFEHARRPRIYYPNLCAVFVFRLYVWHFFFSFIVFLLLFPFGICLFVLCVLSFLLFLCFLVSCLFFLFLLIVGII